jgi:alpha-amylase
MAIPVCLWQIIMGLIMEVGQANCTYVDATEHITEPVVTNEEGWAEFSCEAGSVSVWVPH